MIVVAVGVSMPIMTALGTIAVKNDQPSVYRYITNLVVQPQEIALIVQFMCLFITL